MAIFKEPSDDLVPSGFNHSQSDESSSITWSRPYDTTSSMCPQTGGKIFGNRDCDLGSISPTSSTSAAFWNPELLGVQEAPRPDHRFGVSNKPVFVDAAEMKARVREALFKPAYNVQDLYKVEGLWQCIARSSSFEQVTLAVIAINALWIAVDTDNNSADVLLQAHPLFQAMENFFCLFFTFEWVVRFLAFRRKRFCLKDGWFMFDSVLVFMMVLETWLMSITMLVMNTGGGGAMGNASILRIARLLRLSRMARMARLLRVMPELMIMIKGMMAAIRSVFFTLLLLVIIMYVFGIAFTQLLAESWVGDRYYSSVPHAMYTLLLYGTLLDDIGTLTRDMGKESVVVTALFLVFVLLGALTIMNMLIGVLCEVVSAVAATENEEMLVSWVKSKIEKVVKEIDTDGDQMVSKEEFILILENVGACRALQDVGVDVVGLVDFADVIFEEDDLVGGEKELTFTEFMDIVLQLRGCNNATVKDIVDLRKQVQRGLGQLAVAIQDVSKDVGKVASASLRKLDRPSSRPSFRAGARRPSITRSSSKDRASQSSMPKEGIPENDGQPPAALASSQSEQLNFLAGFQSQEIRWEPLDDTINFNSDRGQTLGESRAGKISEDLLLNASDMQHSNHKPDASSNSKHMISDRNLTLKDKRSIMPLQAHGQGSQKNGVLIQGENNSCLLDLDAEDVNSQLTRLDEALNRLVQIRQKLGVCAWPIEAHKMKPGSSSLPTNL